MYTLIGPDGIPFASRTPGAVGGHRRTKVHGLLDCPAALRAINRGGYVKWRVFFADDEAALSAGFRPCAVCLPEKYRRWKEVRGS
jgi:methylphosphotriester-DNA--protein-cysteine methyltransferase